MSDYDSDIEFYSFIQVNDDLSNTEENNQSLQKQVILPPSITNNNNNEDKFFEKLSFAFYSNNNANPDTNVQDVKQMKGNLIQSEKITLLENQNTQPHTPTYIISRKSDEIQQVKAHHLLKNYQIKKMQKPLPHHEQVNHDDLKKSIARLSIQKLNEEVLSNQQDEKAKSINENLSKGIRNQNCINGIQRRVSIKNICNNLPQEQQSNNQDEKNIHENQNGIENKQNQRIPYDFEEQIKIKKNAMNSQKQVNFFQHNQNDKDNQLQRRSIESNLNSKIENIDTIYLNDALESQEDMKSQINKHRLLHEENKYDFFNSNKKNLLQYLKSPLNPEINNNKKSQIIENTSNKKTEEAEVSLKPIVIKRKSILSTAKDQGISYQATNLNNFPNKEDSYKIQDIIQKQDFSNKEEINKREDFGQIENNNKAQNNNFFKINQTSRVVQDSNIKEERIHFSGRKIKFDNNYDLQSTPLLNDNDLINSNQSIKSPVINKFTPQLKKNGTVQLQEKGYTTPRQLYGTQSSRNSIQNGINMNNLQQPFGSLSVREEHNNNNNNSNQKYDQQQIQNMYSILSKQNQFSNSSTKNYNKNTIQLVNSIDQQSTSNSHKTIKEQQLMVSSFTSPFNQSKSQNTIPLTNSQQLSGREDTQPEHRNSFLSQVFKCKTQPSDNKLMLKNNLIKMPQNTFLKSVEVPLMSSQLHQNFNNQSQVYQNKNNLNLNNKNSENENLKMVQSFKDTSQSTSSTGKKNYFIHTSKKLESIYTNQFEDHQGFQEKITQY